MSAQLDSIKQKINEINVLKKKIQELDFQIKRIEENYQTINEKLNSDDFKRLDINLMSTDIDKIFQEMEKLNGDIDGLYSKLQ